MILQRIALLSCLSLISGITWSGTDAYNDYKTLTQLSGDWTLSPADTQEGGATKKGPAATITGTSNTAMSFKVIGKGSTVQENLLPGTVKEMATMYHCDDFKNCSQVKATHYCAKQNQPDLVLDEEASNSNIILLTCNMDTPLCNSTESHIHIITHELSDDNNHLKTTYTSYKNGEFENDSIYHFDRKQE